MSQVEEIIGELDKILVQQFELDPAQVRPDARLREDLDLDSLDAADLLIAIERRFKIRVDDQAVKQLVTVGEMHDYVRTLVAAAPSS